MPNPPQTPQRFTPRASSSSPGRIRRATGGASESRQRYGDSLEVAADGRVETKIARGGGLRVTAQGLMVDAESVGEKNRPQLASMRDLSASASTGDIINHVNDLISELRRTGNMRSFNRNVL